MLSQHSPFFGAARVIIHIFWWLYSIIHVYTSHRNGVLGWFFGNCPTFSVVWFPPWGCRYWCLPSGVINHVVGWKIPSTNGSGGHVWWMKRKRPTGQDRPQLIRQPFGKQQFVPWVYSKMYGGAQWMIKKKKNYLSWPPFCVCENFILHGFWPLFVWPIAPDN